MKINSLFKPGLIFIIFVSHTIYLFSQQHLDSLFNILGTKYPQEKIYLQIDKTYYNAGEAIWFKAYLISDNLPGALSKTVYAELVNDNGAIIQRKIIPVFESGAASNFDVPDTMNSTNLYIRAYTSWMLNFDSSLLYIKPVYVIPSKPVINNVLPIPSYSLALFPEGGDLVQGVNSRVAFKAIDQDVRPISVSGSVINTRGKLICSFSSVHDGMGYFSILPVAGESYKVIWKDRSGVQHETPLPPAKEQGIAISIHMIDNKLSYTLTRSGGTDESNNSYTLIGQMQQQLQYGAKINLKKQNHVTVALYTDSLPDGVLQVTVFNAFQIPVAERIVFINHNNYSFNTDLHIVEKNLSKHGHNALQIDVGDTLRSNLSVSVTDAGINSVTPNEESIFSTLLLSSDLNGYIYNPAWYFSNDADSAKEFLDLVMMTNGWRRFKWENVLAARWPRINYLPDNYLSVKGNVYGLSKVQLSGQVLTGIFKTKTTKSQFLSIPVGNDGKFQVNGMYFFDTARLYYQFNKDKDKTLTTKASFSFENGFIKPPAQSAVIFASIQPPVKPDPAILQKSVSMASLQRAQFAFNKSKTLEAVKVTTKQKSLLEKLNDQYTSGLFSGGDGYSFSIADDPFAKSALSILTYLQGKVPGLQISTTGEGTVSWRGSPTSIFLNESNTEVGMLQSISMSEVAMIKVFRPPFFGASGGGAGGAIAVYTKKGASSNALTQGLNFIDINGYSAIKEFYSPDYQKNPDPGNGDYRSTLYWNPFILMDKKTRRVILPFYNSDNCKKIRVVVEGINAIGQLTREEKIFE